MQAAKTATTDATSTDNHYYTTSFSSTSSASQIIIRAALIVQEITFADSRIRYRPNYLQGLLSTDGTESRDPYHDRIGVIPDLKAIIRVFAVCSELF